MSPPRLTRWLSVALAALLLAPGSPARAEPSLGEKIRKIFSTPTPTPSPRRHEEAIAEKEQPDALAEPERIAESKAEIHANAHARERSDAKAKEEKILALTHAFAEPDRIPHANP